MGRACEWALVVACGVPEKAGLGRLFALQVKYNEVLVGPARVLSIVTECS